MANTPTKKKSTRIEPGTTRRVTLKKVVPRRNIATFMVASAVLLSGKLLAHEAKHERDSSYSLKVIRKHEVKIFEEGDKRIVEANGLPDHKTGKFPNRNNPNEISEQKYRFEMPLEPEQSNEKVPAMGPQLFGVAVNGVVFDPGTAETWNNDRRWTYEALTGPMNLGLDKSHAHVQPNGAYHYHSMPDGLLKELGAKEKIEANEMVLVGWAADGFPIYAKFGHITAADSSSKLKELKSSYQLKDEKRPSKPDGPGGTTDGSFASDYEYVAGAGDLDEYNGREGITEEFPDGTYYYVLTDDFPYIPRLLRGVSDPSFLREMGGQGGPPNGGPEGKDGPPSGGGRGDGPPPRGGRPPHPPRP